MAVAVAVAHDSRSSDSTAISHGGAGSVLFSTWQKQMIGSGLAISHGVVESELISAELE